MVMLLIGSLVHSRGLQDHLPLVNLSSVALNKLPQRKRSFTAVNLSSSSKMCTLKLMITTTDDNNCFDESVIKILFKVFSYIILTKYSSQHWCTFISLSVNSWLVFLYLCVSVNQINEDVNKTDQQSKFKSNQEILLRLKVLNRTFQKFLCVHCKSPWSQAVTLYSQWKLNQSAQWSGISMR